MIRWLRSLIAWRAVRETGAWVYCENAVTGQHAAHWRGNYQPLDFDFLRDGDVVFGPRGRYVLGTECEIWGGC